MWAPIKELDRRNECFMACEGYKPSPIIQELGKEDKHKHLRALLKANLPEKRENQTKLEAAKQFLKDHPCNPGVLNRWLDSRKTK